MVRWIPGVRIGFGLLIAAAVVLLEPAHGASKSVDLDGQAANGAESLCELNVLQTFPVQIENKITNKSVGNSYTFSWNSGGPGGFTSSVPAGSATGVGAKWVWTTNQTVYSFTGSTCDRDICFAQTGGPDPIPSFCSLACLADATRLTAARGTTTGTVALSWAGGQSTFTVYRSTNRVGVVDPANAVTSTDALQYTDTPPAGGIVYYVVRGVDCTTRKSCSSNTDCSLPGDGTCVSRGPFNVPGRSLLATDVTVSAASLTSSLITFFSPPHTIFEAKSVAGPGGVLQTASNGSTTPVEYTTPAFPEGCCPADPEVPHQLRCGDDCVDYLNDPNNCGGCGTVCGEGECCSNGSCASLCGEGETYCDGECADLQNDTGNCGACGNICGDGSCCYGGSCVSLCGEGETWCDGECANLQSDSSNCGACGNVCGDGTCCFEGSCTSLCADGEAWCGDHCADLQNDSANCGACGNACGDGTCCSEGTCASLCAAGQTWCNGQCVDFQNDSANCGSCGNACGDGTCCNEGLCASVCEAGQTWVNGQCVDFQNDNNNCGSFGNVCGEGTCCNEGGCASLCGAGRTYCDGLCYDTQNDPSNCGACGNTCASDSVCTGGACVRCTGQGGARDACDNVCVNLNTDPYNCGACGTSCHEGCPSGFKGVCSNGQSCSCVEGTPAPPPPSNIPPPTPPFCPNLNPSPGPVAGVCPNSNPSSPVDGVCPNTDPSSPRPGYCPNPDPTSPGPGACPNPSPSSPEPGFCPDPGSLPPPVDETPTCVVNAITQTIPPGGTSIVCNPGGVLFKEVPTLITVCGDGIPGVDGTCNDSASKVTTGTFNRLVPDTSKTVGNAYVTTYAVHVLNDTSRNGLLEPGESAELVVDVLNAGPLNVSQASATLSAATVDLSEDGTVNPVGITVAGGAASYGTILGTAVSTDCTAPVLHPASNETAFSISVPPDHPGGTSHPVMLAVTGTVNDGPFSMNVPFSLGIADKCDPAASIRDYDGIDGLSTPMAQLVPVGDPVPFPVKAFSAGNTRPMKLRVTCDTVNLTDALVDAPQVVALSEATRGALDITALNLNSDNGTNPNDPFFRFNNTLSGGQWTYSMRTALIGTGSFTITIRIAGRKDYVTGFVLE